MFNRFVDYQDPDSWISKIRDRRFRFFDSKLSALRTRPITILDVGGTEDFWRLRGLADHDQYKITVLNLELISTTAANIQGVKGNATDLGEYGDNSFDIVFSNSVIEHLYTWENQEKMAAEVRRVGVHYFIQTPNKYFPMEPHYLVPFFDLLPRGLKLWILTKTSWALKRRWTEEEAQTSVDEIQLLSFRKFQQLFPGSQMYKERLFGLVKSFTAHSFDQ